MTTNLEAITKIITEHLGVTPDKVTPETTLESLGADSLDRIELAMAVEEDFEIEISDDIVATWNTVGDVENYLNSL